MWLKLLLRGEEPLNGDSMPLHRGAFSLIHYPPTSLATGLIPAIPLSSILSSIPRSYHPTGSNLGRWLKDFPNQAFSVRHHLPLSCPTSSSKRNASLHRPYRHGFPVYVECTIKTDKLLLKLMPTPRYVFGSTLRKLCPIGRLRNHEDLQST